MTTAAEPASGLKTFRNYLIVMASAVAAVVLLAAWAYVGQPIYDVAMATSQETRLCLAPVAAGEFGKSWGAMARCARFRPYLDSGIHEAAWMQYVDHLEQRCSAVKADQTLLGLCEARIERDEQSAGVDWTRVSSPSP